MAETLSHFSKILTNADDKVRLLKSLSYTSNILSPQLFGEKDSFTFGALRQLGKHINEVHMNCNSSYRPPIPFHYCSMITFSSFFSLSLCFQLYSWQDMLCTQIDQAIVQQLDSFLSNDLSRVTSLKEAFHYARNGMRVGTHNKPCHVGLHRS